MNYWHHPEIDPVIIDIGKWFGYPGYVAIRWYSVLYVGGFMVGRYILKRLAHDSRFQHTEEQAENLTLWLLISAVIGARVFYCFVYDPQALMANPLYLFQTYKGGLSFHGSLIGVIIAAYWFSKKNNLSMLNLTDAMALATPPGLAMGRMGNFINGELWGRVTTVPWAMIFRDGGPLPRHPSQLYELFLEGFVLMGVLLLVKKRSTTNGMIGATFVIGYSVARFIVEFFREPDAQVGYLTGGLSMGQILSLIAIVVMIPVMILLRKNAATSAE